MLDHTLTLLLSNKTHEQLDKLASKTGRSKSFLASEALQSYLEIQSWQVEEIEKGVEEANARDFASDSDVEAVFSKWLIE